MLLNFSSQSICPKCNKPVYLAEQVIGPGRKLYHKPCLACTICNKRLDSLGLREHNQEPYCKSCHVKNFGTQDLRQANLPYRARSPSPSPQRSSANQTSSGSLTSPIRTQSFATGNGYTPQIQANRTFSPTSTSFQHNTRAERVDSPSGFDEEAEEAMDVVGDNLTRASVPPTVSLSATGLSQIVGDDDLAAAAAVDRFTNTLGRRDGNAVRPVISTLTGTRYGTALDGSVASHSTGSPRKWGGAPAPKCPKCSQSVYFAEQMKAVGKTWHKNCLRCTECNTILDSTKLRDHEDTPFCSRCYNKLHGPQGNGYALLGKAGG